MHHVVVVVVVRVGVDPATELAEGSGIHVDDGIVVNEFCETSVDGMYSAGDVASHPHPILGERFCLEHYQTPTTRRSLRPAPGSDNARPSRRSPGSGLTSTT